MLCVDEDDTLWRRQQNNKFPIVSDVLIKLYAVVQ